MGAVGALTGGSAREVHRCLLCHELDIESECLLLLTFSHGQLVLRSSWVADRI